MISLILLPLIIAVLGLMPRMSRHIAVISASLMLLQLPVAVWICLPAFRGQTVVAGNFAVDGVGAVFTIITTLVALAAMLQAALQLPAERLTEHKTSDKAYCGFFSLSALFLIAMYAVPLSQHLGVIWMAIEATTLMSAPLVYYHRSRSSLEATWKYLLLCSVGIAFALFGTVMLFASQHSFNGESMMLADLTAHAKQLDPKLLSLGFIFCLLGYGTKAGIFPLHNWLPDAHSEAPAPSSAMLSGSLLNCALVAIWRLSQLMAAAGQADLVRDLLVPAGAITVIAASLMLVRQHDLKRMLAYSSVEHIGLLTLAIGIGSTPLFMLHAFNHSIIKVALFLMAGSILHVYGTKQLSKLGGLLKSSPLWGAVLMLAGFAIAGSPPFGTFISEWLLLRDTLSAGEVAATVTVIVGLTITFIAITTHLGKVVFGIERPLVHGTPQRSWAYVPVCLLVLSLLAGVAIAPNVMSRLVMLAQLGGAR